MCYILPKQIPKNCIHLLVWATTLVYLAFAPDLYVRFILKEGKPVQLDQSLPQPTDEISFGIDRLDLVKGQELFNLVGWSFFRGDSDQAAYTRWIVLQSDVHTYLYPAKSFRTPRLPSIFQDVTIDLTNAGVSASMSKLAIEPGVYQIGVLFEHKVSNDVYYAVTNRMIIRTINQIRLSTLNPVP